MHRIICSVENLTEGFKILADYHVHPDFSIDAQNSIDQYCRQALKLNLKEICFTTHYECDPVRKHLDWFVQINGVKHPMDDWYWVDRYFEEIEQAKAKYQPLGLILKAGVEVGYERGLENNIARLLNNYPFDFVLGSIHALDHIAISNHHESPFYFTGKTSKQVLAQYYQIVCDLVECCLFDCVGHIDIYRRYGSKYLGAEIEKVDSEIIMPVLNKMKQLNIGMEINTSSLRRGHREFHPNRELLNLAVKCGINIFTIGSDAHRITQLGEGVAEAEEMLKKLGQSIAVFNRRKPLLIS